VEDALKLVDAKLGAGAEMDNLLNRLDFATETVSNLVGSSAGWTDTLTTLLTAESGTVNGVPQCDSRRLTDVYTAMSFAGIGEREAAEQGYSACRPTTCTRSHPHWETA
jgi:hypothetical protein